MESESFSSLCAQLALNVKQEHAVRQRLRMLHADDNTPESSSTSRTARGNPPPEDRAAHPPLLGMQAGAVQQPQAVTAAAAVGDVAGPASSPSLADILDDHG